MNVRGLRKKKKRRALFFQFKKRKFDIIALQDTHLTMQDKNMIESEWCGKIHLLPGSNHQNGLLTLFSKQTVLKLKM